MKKLISYIIVAAMLFGMIAPSVAALENTPRLLVQNIEITMGGSNEALLSLSVENNPGLYSLSFVVYYDSSVFSQGSLPSFEGTLALEDDCSIGGELSGTHSKVKSYIPTELRATSRAFLVEIYGAYDSATGDSKVIYDDGVLVNIPLKVISEYAGSFDFNVAVVEACDADGNEIEFDNVSGSVNYIDDPFADMYEDFAVVMDPAESGIKKGVDSFDVDVRLCNNPGLWASRFYIVYPPQLSLSDGSEHPSAMIKNSCLIFEDESDMIVGTPDLCLEDPLQTDGFKEVMKNDPEIVKAGYRSTTVYFEENTYDQMSYGDGVLCTLTFNVSDDVEFGDVLDIRVYCGESDFINAYLDSETGTPVFTKYRPETVGADVKIIGCMHVEKITEKKDADCGYEGYERVVCAVCGEVFEETIYPVVGEHVADIIERVEPTCAEDGYVKTTCSVCGLPAHETEILPATGDHIPGPEATCSEPQLCTTCCAVLHDATGIHTPGPEATCTSTQVCTVCGEVINEALPHERDGQGICKMCHTFESDHKKTPSRTRWELVIPYAKSISLTFSPETKTYNYDYIYIYDVSGDLIGCYSWDDLAGETVKVPGHAAVVEYKASSSYAYIYYGFKVTSVSVEYYPTFGDFSYTVDADSGSALIMGWFGEGDSVRIPAKIDGLPVTYIAEGAFCDCKGIKTVFLPDSIESVGANAFYGCGGLSVVCYAGAYGSFGSVSFAEGNDPLLAARRFCLADDITDDGYVFSLDGAAAVVSGYIGDAAELHIPFEIEGLPVTEISYRAFYDCDNIKKIYIPEGVTAIGGYAFASSGALAAIYVPSSVLQIGSGVFQSCPAKMKIYFSGTYDEWLSLKTGTEAICNFGTPMEGFVYSFDGVNNTVKITGYNGDSADIVIPEEFYGYTITEIDPDAFAKRADIISISIPGTVRCIEERSFEDCVNLSGVSFGVGVVEIGDYAFSGCTSLSDLTLSESLEYIWTYAFNRCTSLESVYLPASVSVIEYKAFYRCDSVVSVVYNGSPSQFEKVYVGNGNDSIIFADVVYLLEDEPVYVFIPVPEGMRAEDCILYYVDAYGVATEVIVECIDGYFVAMPQKVGYYILKHASYDEPEEPDAPAIGSGDLDKDGRVTSLDANKLQRIISGLGSVDAGSEEFVAADINGDGSINAIDANMLKRILVGII